MKSKKKILAVLLAVAALISMTGFTANAATKATSITFSRTNDMVVKVGYAITRTAVTTPEGLAVTYTSSDTTIAAVNENGQVVGKKPGKAVITATADGLNASYNVVVIEAVSTKIFDGFTVTVLDKTTPAVTIMGRTTDRNVMCFLSADGKEVGSISYSDYNAIIKKNQKVVNLNGGGTYGAPPVDGKSWEAWFADELNKYRGLDTGSRQEVVNEFSTNGKFLSDYQNDIINLTNEERKKAGSPALIVDSELTELAQIRAQEQVVQKGHTRPDGTTVMDLGYGENLTSTPTTPSSAMQNWMNSTTHKQNILLNDYVRIGVGCYSVGDRIYWVQIFAFDLSWY